ncbi:hypothetical protein WA026_010179, partial [Henosepilachna vigintioctopunctata]
MLDEQKNQEQEKLEKTERQEHDKLKDQMSKEPKILTDNQLMLINLLKNVEQWSQENMKKLMKEMIN